MPLAASLSTIASSPTLRHRLPLVGTFCVLGTLGLSILCPSLSLSSKTGSAHALPLAPLFRSKFSSQTPAKSVHKIRMEANSSTVPSIVVYVTVPNKEAGKKLAEGLVKEKLAACVNRVPGMQWMKRWWQSEVDENWLGFQIEVQTDSEELLIIKTRESLLEALKEYVKANHEYEVPEVIAMPIIGGSIPYLEWIKNSTRD
ncbi:nitrogen regulatory PII-like, alpha/beta [Actinidia rufa]|uniref:Nitrogen regulatory PII-like, alpha/beta n=1 Tax=Actinidia rufa TaxID=165716 RepID=A0A7J0FBI4_9ERIC|nr:nitrogen regulatory PII-like, alpha/beta [Actinidia rufa]